jgi:hypothetical protein
MPGDGREAVDNRAAACSSTAIAAQIPSLRGPSSKRDRLPMFLDAMFLMHGLALFAQVALAK